MKRTVLTAIGLGGLALSACSSSAPMAPVGTSRHPANSASELAALTAPRTLPVSSASPGPNFSSPDRPTFEEARAAAQTYVETKNVSGFTFSDYSAPGGFLAIEPETKATVLSLARSASSVRILCRTDKKKPSKAAYLAALRRGAVVRRYLLAQGVPAAKVRIFVKSTGAFVADNSTKIGKAKNRRVEIKFA